MCNTIFLISTIIMVATFIAGGRRSVEYVLSIWKRFRLRMLCEVLVLLFLVLVVGSFLRDVPGLKYGWMDLFHEGGGSSLSTPIVELSKSTRWFFRVFAVIITSALIFVLPFLAVIEEEVFRRGYNDWKRIARQSIIFGFVHFLFVGISLATTVAIIGVGLFLGAVYKHTLEKKLRSVTYDEAEDEAVIVATAYHTMYNTMLFSLLLYAMIKSF